MELSMLLAQQIVVLFLEMAVGYLLVKIKILKPSDSDVIAKMVVYVCSPCVVINAFATAEFSSETFSGFMVAIIGAVISFATLITIGKVLDVFFHIHHLEKASLVYSNCGYLIIPLVSAVLGEEWVFYTSAYVLVSTMLFWSHGLSIISEEKHIDVVKMIKNPNIIAIFAGLIIFLANITLPTILSSFTSGFGSAIGPVSMMNVGMIFASMDLVKCFQNKRAYFVALGRLIITPLILILILRVCGIMSMHPLADQILLITLLAASAPCAVNITQVAQLYHKDSVYASSINVISVLFCLITMPAMVAIFQIVM